MSSLPEVTEVAPFGLELGVSELLGLDTLFLPAPVEGRWLHGGSVTLHRGVPLSHLSLEL